MKKIWINFQWHYIWVRQKIIWHKMCRSMVCRKPVKYHILWLYIFFALSGSSLTDTPLLLKNVLLPLLYSAKYQLTRKENVVASKTINGNTGNLLWGCTAELHRSPSQEQYQVSAVREGVFSCSLSRCEQAEFSYRWPQSRLTTNRDVYYMYEYAKLDHPTANFVIQTLPNWIHVPLRNPWILWQPWIMQRSTDFNEEGF